LFTRTRTPPLAASAYFDSVFTSGLASNLLRMRRNSMKLSAVMVHITEANMIITFVSIGAGSCPDFQLYQGTGAVGSAGAAAGAGIVTGAKAQC
jgi:hypothetical protein